MYNRQQITIGNQLMRCILSKHLTNDSEKIKNILPCFHAINKLTKGYSQKYSDEFLQSVLYIDDRNYLRCSKHFNKYLKEYINKISEYCKQLNEEE